MAVAALVPVISVPQFLPTVQTLTEELDRAGYQLILGQTGYDRARERALLDTMIGRRVDGIVVAGLLHDDAATERLRRLGIPVVETWDFSERPVDMAVGFSHVKVGSAVAGYFLGQGLASGSASPRRRPARGAAARGLPLGDGPRRADRDGAGAEHDARSGGARCANCWSRIRSCRPSAAARTASPRAC